MGSLLTYERKLWRSGLIRIAGVDEAGRGPLAGPVVAAAVIFPQGARIRGIDDSKKVAPEDREKLHARIHERALAVGIGIVSHETIDRINILQATMRAMAEAVAALSPAPEHLLIDGNYYRNEGFPFTTIIGGDAACYSIAAASIVAKVTRDRIMIDYHEQYPQYGFAGHKGYGTREHIAALRQYGPCDIHRKSFHVHSLTTRTTCHESPNPQPETADLFEQA